jgi:peptidoglycan/LPS O-acetylase OafA/YrhL
MSSQSKSTAEVTKTEPRSVAHGKAVTEYDGPVLPAHFSSLDGFRGLAVLLVMFIHFGNNAKSLGYDNIITKLSSIGWIGVDLFFVLSGFLITRILYDAKTKPNYFSRFYIRRTLRIFPLYYLAIVVVSLIYALWPFADLSWPDSPLFVVFYLTNFLIAAGGSGGMLDHFWSLAVEEHFYLIWPFVVLRFSRRQLMMVALLVIVAAPLLRTYFVLNGFNEYTAYMLTPCRMDSLAMGAFVALAVCGSGFSSQVSRAAWIAVIIGGGAVAFIFFGLRMFSPSEPLIGSIGFSIIGVAAAGLLVLTVVWKPLHAIFSLPVMRWFGKYSYGLYVWHPIIGMLIFYSGLREQFPASVQNSLIWLWLAVGLSLAVSWLSYNLWEAQFLRLKDKLAAAPPRLPRVQAIQQGSAGGNIAD